MYLKSLTLRGFKSFASSTTLQLEPGITCVVGPNGSGKSNVVDALSWVMGEQGAKSLRGGKMEDVIFAGTSGRPPLGRAEVVLTIDNTDGALPIEYTEVTISRTMFRNGGSEYAINGNTCRLLDVQELLSDSGIGREMHVIVGQGQLDSVLRATPEERRGFIEEAAGVLKHRKRKEKALRKLDATQGNLTRLNDVLTELRRQLKPLGRQAEVARRAAVIQAEVRDARARILADDIVSARSVIAEELADETALKERRQAVEQSIAAAREQETELEDQLREDSPRLSAAQETWYSLSGLRERIRGTAGLANERVRLAAVEAEDRRVGREPEELEADARRAQEQLEQLSAGVTAGDRVARGRHRRAQRGRVGLHRRGAPGRGSAARRRRPARRAGAAPRPGQRPQEPRDRRRRGDRPAHRRTRGGREPRGRGAPRVHEPREPDRRPQRGRVGARRGARGGRGRARRDHPAPGIADGPGAGGRAPAGRVRRPQGGPRAGPGPQGRRRRAARGDRRDQRSAGLGRRTVDRTRGVRDRDRLGARLRRRCCGRRSPRHRCVGDGEAQVRGPRARRHAARRWRGRRLHVARPARTTRRTRSTSSTARHRCRARCAGCCSRSPSSTASSSRRS